MRIFEAHLFFRCSSPPAGTTRAVRRSPRRRQKPIREARLGTLFRRGPVTFVTGFIGAALAATLAWSSVAQAQSEPPGRVGRLAFTDGTVSLHDNEQSAWAPAVVNTPLSTGDSLWTEPNARSEISLAGTRIRMAGATQRDMLAADHTHTRLPVDQGRVDINTQAMDPTQPSQLSPPP